MAKTGNDRPVCILHLSDIHFRASKAWDAESVLRDLAGFIGQEVEEGRSPDLVAITGDLAFAGIAKEYKLARAWLDTQLWPKLGDLARDRLLLVPGNHDVDRSKVNFVAKAAQNTLLTGRDQDQIATVLGDKTQRDALLKRHTAYIRFVSDWLGQPQTLPWWQREIEVRGTRLLVCGLDSAWMACADDDRNRLLLGHYQLTQTVDTARADGIHWKIALLHHPWSYLAEFDEFLARRIVHQHCDLLLRGHLHFPQSERILPPDPSRACLELAAGCVYENSYGYPNAFQWIELSPAGKRVRVLYRIWEKGEWTIDRNQPNCPNGHADFDLAALSPDTRKGRSDEPPPADFRKYVEDLWADTARIDIRGLVTGRPEAHSFPIEDLYIELSATGGGYVDSDRDSRTGGNSLLKAALKNPRLVIIGDPGCGKTTFLRWIAHCLSADRLGKQTGAAHAQLGLDRARLPVLIAIADWLDFIARAEAQNDGPALSTGALWLPEYLGARSVDANQRVSSDDFRRQLSDGDCLILLDGLDEAPDYQQRQRAVGLIERLEKAYPCPVVVTSRPAAYQDKAVLSDFTHTHIEALDPVAIDGFLTRWSRVLFPDREDKAENHRKELAAALVSRPEIRRMARNTVMLTALAVVHWNEKRLPEQRAELYESILKWLIEAREQRPGREKPQRCRQLLAELALAMQSDEEGRRVQVSRRWAAERLGVRFGSSANAIELAESFLAEEEIDSGIVVRRGHQLRFWHLTFQEYLAAQALAGRQDAERMRLLLGPTTAAIYISEWRETVLLLGGVLYLQGEDKVDGLLAGVLDHLGASPSRSEQARTAGLLGALVRDLQSFGYHPADARYDTLLEAAMAVFDPQQAPAIPVGDRIAAADALALAGDPRLGWASLGRWIDLPSGRFKMGAQRKNIESPGYDPKARDDEGPVHDVIVDAFRIARFPVTVAEYAEFINDENNAASRWWQAGGGDQGAVPGSWEEDQQSHPSRPIVNVSWHQAMAFCAWLTDRLSRPQGAKGEVPLPGRHIVRIPTEAEWEYAARGQEGRRYPWGNEPPDRQRANLATASVVQATPVGIFTRDVTPEGVLEMAGNVREWCLDPYDSDFYAHCDRRGTVTNPIAPGRGTRVLRGGSWDDVEGGARAANRSRHYPGGGSVGFRVVCSRPIFEH